jgi:hypothetical protein
MNCFHFTAAQLSRKDNMKRKDKEEKDKKAKERAVSYQ